MKNVKMCMFQQEEKLMKIVVMLGSGKIFSEGDDCSTPNLM